MVLAALDTSDAIALGAAIVAILALGVAVWSVFTARGANKLSEDSNKISLESNDIAREALHHSARGVELAESVEARRQREQSARAVMRAEVTPLFHTAQASKSYFRPLVRVENIGERDSGPTMIRLYMRAGEDLMAWDDEHSRPDRARPITDPDVAFYRGDGGSDAAQYIERRVDNITRSMPVEYRAMLPVPIPPEGQGRYRLPVRVVVRAAHADEPFEWTDYVQTAYGPSPA